MIDVAGTPVRMIAAGLDIGGTKIETQVFDACWRVVDKQRRPTPERYDALVKSIAEQIGWAQQQAQGQGDGPLAIGLSVAGLIHPGTGRALTANLPANGQPLAADIVSAVASDVTYLNDCRALALSEAVFGAGKGFRTVMAVILGTGTGGGIAVDHRILKGPTATGGEFGHTAAPAHLVAAHHLPIMACGCGRRGCIETYVSGPGLQRLAKHMTGVDATPPEIAADRRGAMAQVWDVWCAFAAEMVTGLTLIADPDVIVLGGGLTRIDGMVEDVRKAALAAQLHGFDIPPLALAQGGDASGARGAAYAAVQERQLKSTRLAP